MNVTSRQPSFDDSANAGLRPQQPAGAPSAASPFPQPARQPQQPAPSAPVPHAPAAAESAVSTPAVRQPNPTMQTQGAPATPMHPASVRERPMSAQEAARLAQESAVVNGPAQEVEAEIIDEAKEPSGSTAKDVACVVGGAAIAAVGVPMMVLPGPGVAAIAGGVALAGKGAKSLAQRAGMRSAEKPLDVENLAGQPQTGVAEDAAQAAAADRPAEESRGSHADRPVGAPEAGAFPNGAQSSTPPGGPTADDVKQAAANAAKAAIGAASLAAQAIAAKARDSKELESARANAVRTARDLAEKAASSPAAQTAAQATASAARALAERAEAFARDHRR